MKTIFTYGTLMQGERLHYYLNGAKFIGPAVLSGAKLYDLGNDVPGIYPGDAQVHGEVFEVSDFLFKGLLYLESGYVDTPVKVTLEDQTEVEAIAFVWPDITKGYGTSRTPEEVESGDWREK